MQSKHFAEGKMSVIAASTIYPAIGIPRQVIARRAIIERGNDTNRLLLVTRGCKGASDETTQDLTSRGVYVPPGLHGRVIYSKAKVRWLER